MPSSLQTDRLWLQYISSEPFDWIGCEQNEKNPPKLTLGGMLPVVFQGPKSMGTTKVSRVNMEKDSTSMQ